MEGEEGEVMYFLGVLVHHAGGHAAAVGACLLLAVAAPPRVEYTERYTEQRANNNTTLCQGP